MFESSETVAREESSSGFVVLLRREKQNGFDVVAELDRLQEARALLLSLL